MNNTNGVNPGKRIMIGSRVSSQNRVNSFMLAMLISISAINNIVTGVMPSLEGIFMKMCYLLVGGYLIVAALFSAIKDPKVSLRSGIVFISIVLNYILSYSISRIEPMFFAVFCIIPLLATTFLICKDTIDIRYMLRATMTIPAFGVLFIEQIFNLDINRSITMGQSYAFLTPILANIVFHVCYYNGNLKGWNKVLYWFATVANIFYLFEIMVFGSRGAILSVVTCVVFLLGFKYSKENKRLQTAGIRFWVIALLVIILAFNFWDVVLYITRFVHINTLDKLVRLHLRDNVLNNRSLIYKMAFDKIPNHIFFGHGIGSFAYYTGESYPHNFILQSLFDGGIYLFWLTVIPALVGFTKMFRRCSYTQYSLVVFLVFSSVIKAFFSGDIWENEKLWLCCAVLSALSSSSSFLEDNVSSDMQTNYIENKK